MVKDLINDVSEVQRIADTVHAEIKGELESLTWQDIEMSADLDIALGELDSRSTRLRGVVFERWLDIWLDVSGAVRDKHFRKNLNQIFRETLRLN